MTEPNRLPTPPELIIFDFDGVVADSELLSNTLMAEFLTQTGLPTTARQAIERYMGRRTEDWVALVEKDYKAKFECALPPDFISRYRTFTGDRMRRDVEPVPGVAAFLAANPACRFCVASSATPGWLDHGADKFGLRPHLGANLFSATQVARGKPAPDIFLFAAREMGVAPGRCGVIEDSAAGVVGAVAAGMTVIGFLGGAHIQDGHRDLLRAAGAHHIARTYDDVADQFGLRRPPSPHQHR